MGKTAQVPTTSDFERLLRSAALRVTRPRVAVLSAVLPIALLRRVEPAMILRGE